MSMQVLIKKPCIVSFECSNNFEMVYEGNKIIIREAKPILDDVVLHDIELKGGDIYDKIVQLCKIRHMTLSQLAFMIDMPYTTLHSKIRRHPKKVSEEFIHAVATVLDVELNKLKEV